ncbi:DNA-binding MarR family transcriptional regulator [Streptosporangium album]|uniref:DNA-binding MarR family transcriptional regulator n=1 Tax=Streptosporangium album TaxID=47479 RepID=A0A7W7RSA8_9ACTN|nr:MarR family transcriptional regulator [Streptosporangium album]MBB4936668.1 DNA-binding MarR family transcriptional regulator [Streptosporangium album]
MTDGREVAASTGPVGYALAQVTRAHRTEMQRRMAELGLHLGQELLIVDLHRNPDSTQAELVQRIGMEQPTIAKAITRMERSGFVERTADPRDRRVTRLRLTGQGEAVVEAVVAAWAGVEDLATAGLAGDDVRQLLGLLDRIRHNLT